MKVKNVRRNTMIAKASDLDILGATLLTVEEIKQLPVRLREYNNYWWLKSPCHDFHSAAYVDSDGLIYGEGYPVYANSFVARPALVISNLESSVLRIGDTFEFGDKDFEIISNDKAFCLSDIGTCAFRRGRKASDDNDYEKSDIKKYVDDWFKKSKNEPRDYVFYYFNGHTETINNADSFKDAVYKLYVSERVGRSLDEVFPKALKGFDDNDIDGIISLYNMFCYFEIFKVCLLSGEQIYGRKERIIYDEKY